MASKARGALAHGRLLVRCALLGGVAFAVAACPSKRVRRDYDAPTQGELDGVVRGLQGRAQSFRANTVMDYMLGDKRQKGEVKIMAMRGKKMRVNALNPAGDSPAMDFACDGTNFQMVDFLNDCQLTGPCDAMSVEQFFRVRIEPDDFIDIATGGAPVLGALPDGAAETAAAWDDKLGAERLSLVAPSGTQELWLAGRSHGWAVLRSDVLDAAGALLWKLENKHFSPLVVGDRTFYVPGKSRFRSPGEDSDLIVEWHDRSINVEISQDKFTFEIPPGLPMCGAKAAP